MIAARMVSKEMIAARVASQEMIAARAASKWMIAARVVSKEMIANAVSKGFYSATPMKYVQKFSNIQNAPLPYTLTI